MLVIISAMALEAEAIEADGIITTSVVAGLDLPIGDPRNPGKPLQVPGMVVQWNLDKATALKWAERLKEEADLLPDKAAGGGVILPSFKETQAVQQTKP